MATKVNKDGKKPPSAATNLIGESYGRTPSPRAVIRHTNMSGRSQPAVVRV
jgi:hypothetical protein